MKIFEVSILALLVASACARPQFSNFAAGDSSEELNFEIDSSEELDEDGNFNRQVIEDLAARDLYDLNPTYAYEYQVAADDTQTYIKHKEARESDIVTGEYQYVDPLGSLIVVKYTAGPDGYQETRTEEKNFIAIRALADRAPVKKVEPAPAPQPIQAKPAQDNSEDLIAKIIGQLTPFIKNTVSNSLKAGY